tara:strand:- start:654 stop:1280 length:627 start_codon:yes stop_codon:yes gene_type:complete
MKSIFNFIVKPLNERYDNEVKIGDISFTVNTKIDDFINISRNAIVVSTPLAYETSIKIGDEIIVHHNIFRRWYDIKGKERNSAKYFKDNLYFAQPDQVFLYKKDSKWISFNDSCFVQPIKNNNKFKTDKTKKLIGILKIGNSSLKALGINPGDIVGFRPKREWEFALDGELLYCMKSNDIVIKYGHKENEIEYNPSWASSRRGVDQSS